MAEERSIRIVMLNTDCSREEAVEALERENGRVSSAIRRVVRTELGFRECLSCGEALDAGWRYCPHCGEIGG